MGSIGRMTTPHERAIQKFAKDPENQQRFFELMKVGRDKNDNNNRIAQVIIADILLRFPFTQSSQGQN